MAETAANPPPTRIKTYEAVVLESIVETPDTRTLVLDTGSAPLRWRASQYLSIDPHQYVGLQSFVGYLEQEKGRREAPRAYSMCSAPHDPHLAVTVKEEVFERGKTKYPPLISGFLVHHVRAGDRMIVTGFAGGYVFPDDVEARTDHVLHICAGSGSVPNVSMIKDSLRRHSRLRHTFVYSNKTWQDVIFREALTELQDRHPARLQVIHALTRETGPLPTSADVRSGRIDARLLDAVLEREPGSLVYACGPAITVWERRACAARGATPAPQFLEAMISLLEGLGFPHERIKLESYG
ncbi:MAG: oxidoreductase [Vicinamibacterales bacterium]